VNRVAFEIESGTGLDRNFIQISGQTLRGIVLSVCGFIHEKWHEFRNLNFSLYLDFFLPQKSTEKSQSTTEVVSPQTSSKIRNKKKKKKLHRLPISLVFHIGTFLSTNRNKEIKTIHLILKHYSPQKKKKNNVVCV